MRELHRKTYQTVAELVSEYSHDLPDNDFGTKRSVCASVKIHFLEEQKAELTLETTITQHDKEGKFCEDTDLHTVSFDPEGLMALQEAFASAVRQSMAENGLYKDVGREFAIAGV